MSQFNRRTFIQMGATASLAAISCSRGAQTSERKPNIVYIMLDDLGFDLGCYGGKQVQTPHIDQLAAEGARFTEAYSGCTVCAPARSTLMTGTHMGHTPVRRNSGGVSLQADSFTVAQMLSANGYVCGGFGKWGIGDLDTPGVPERHGFQRFFGYYHQVHAHFFYPEYLIDTGKNVPLPGNQGMYGEEGERKKQEPVSLQDSASGQERSFAQYLVMDEMKKFIRENKAQPFFCYGPWTIPHGRFEIPESDPAWQLYKDKPWSMNARIYAAYVTMADRYVGEIVALLKELDIDNDTILFFCSDNGAAAQYPGELDSTGSLRGGKTSMYEGGIRVPFIVRWPGRIAPESIFTYPTYFPDFLPTAADIAGIQPDVPQQLDGISILPLLTDAATPPQERHMYWEWNKGHFAPYDVHMQAHRHGKWKIVRNDVSQPWELYNLETDVSESSNLASENPDVVERMAAWVTANRVDPPEQVEPEKPEGQKWR